MAAKVLAVAMGLALALPAVPASAMGKMTAKLSIRPIPEHICGQLTCAGRWDLTVDATVALSSGEAVNVTDNKIAIRLWGDDPSSDDLIRGPIYIPYRAPSGSNVTCSESAPILGYFFYRVPGALKIRGCLRVPRHASPLDEDDSVFDDSDEIYAGVRLISPHVGAYRLAETNRIYGRY